MEGYYVTRQAASPLNVLGSGYTEHYQTNTLQISDNLTQINLDLSGYRHGLNS